MKVHGTALRAAGQLLPPAVIGAFLIVSAFTGSVSAEPSGIGPDISGLLTVPPVLRVSIVEDSTRLRTRWLDTPAPGKPSGSAFWLSSSVAQEEPDGFTGPLDEKERTKVFNVFAGLPFFEGGLSGEGRVGHRPTGADSVIDPDDRANRLLQLILKGTWGAFSYGGEYRSVGKAFERATVVKLPSDQEGSNLWAQRSFGPASVKLFVSEFWNNLDTDRARPRTTRTEGGLSLTLVPPSWPGVTLSYSRGQLETSREPVGTDRGLADFDTVGLSLFYGGPIWDVALSSTYSPIKDRLRPGRDTLALYQGVSGSLRPTRFLTITSSLGFQEERYLWSGEGSQTPVGSVSLTLSPLFGLYDLSTYASYSGTSSSDLVTDTRTTEAGLTMTRTLSKSRAGTQTISAELAYYKYRDGIYPSSSSEEIRALLRLKLLAF